MLGNQLGNYEIVEELGRGGMAVVYRAHQPSLNRDVAIKVLPPQFSFDQKFVERFQREARAAARLRHPNIVVIHDVAQHEGIYYIVMEYLEGRTLKEVIEQEGSLAPHRAAQLIEQIAEALDYAHQQGFVHRDIKPSNIFVGKGDHVTLTDFGIAKAASETQQLTRTGMLMGTPEYMAPEQAEGGEVDERTDLYALGVVLYQMLVGNVPFSGTTPHATLHAVIYEAPPPPRRIKPGIPPSIESVILRAIAKQPDERYQRGADLTSALNAALVSPRQAVSVPPPPTLPPLGSVPPAPTGQRRSPVVWLVVAIAVVLVALLSVLLVLFFGDRNGDEVGTPPDTQVAVVTPTITDSVRTATPEATATTAPTATETTEIPTDTPHPATDTAVAPTDVAPTNTSAAPTDSPTPTVTPSATPTTPPPPSPCAFPAQGLFANLWQTYREQLGCPLYQNPKPIQDAEQSFDNGHMFWRQDNDYAYVVYEKGGLNGSYQAFVDQWVEGDPDYSCAASPPPSKVQPKRGFGAVWCTLGGPSAAIGWGLAEEAGFGPGYGDPLVQDFEEGFILRDSDGTNHGLAYVFVTDSLKFIRVPY